MVNLWANSSLFTNLIITRGKDNFSLELCFWSFDNYKSNIHCFHLDLFWSPPTLREISVSLVTVLNALLTSWSQTLSGLQCSAFSLQQGLVFFLLKSAVSQNNANERDWTRAKTVKLQTKEEKSKSKLWNLEKKSYFFPPQIHWKTGQWLNLVVTWSNLTLKKVTLSSAFQSTSLAKKTKKRREQNRNDFSCCRIMYLMSKQDNKN